MKKLLSILMVVILGMSLTACDEKSKNRDNEDKVDDNMFSFEYMGFYTAGIDFKPGEYKLDINGEGWADIEIITFTEDNEPVTERFYLCNSDVSMNIGDASLVFSGIDSIDSITLDKGTVVKIIALHDDPDYYFEPIEIFENDTERRKNTAILEKTLEAGEYKVGIAINPGTYDLYLEALNPDWEYSWVDLDFEERKNEIHDNYIYSSFPFSDASEFYKVYKNVPFDEGDVFTIENGSIRFVPSK